MDMILDINLLRSAVTAFSLVLFVGIALWTWSRRQRPQHEAAALLPFLDEDAESAAPTATARPHGS